VFLPVRRLGENPGAVFDVCVIGAGAAGITLGCALDGSGHRVCLLESGGEQAEPRLQQLYRGSRIGVRYPPLENGRLRYFGGTTNHWAGWCRPPRAADLRHRPWIPHSGWPLAAEELAPYLESAAAACDLGPGGFEPGAWLGPGSALYHPNPALFETRCTRFSPPTRFAARYRRQLTESDNVEVYLGASVVALVTGEGGASMERLEVVDDDGVRFPVRARVYVLATGGIENARLLLAGVAPGRRGIGNRRDQVGRCFMDHTKFQVGMLELPPGQELDFYQRHRFRSESLMGVLGFTEEALRAHRMSPAHFEFRPAGGDGSGRYRVSLRIDPSPNPDSRIRLDRVVDRHGMPRVLLDLRYRDADSQTLKTAVVLLSRAVTAHGARFEADDALQTGSIAALKPAATGFHHMGSTRMSDDPRSGVVDRDCRVHSVSNLYVAGCSVFPGYEGYPTMTLVALAQRLGDHLDRLLS
jgi:choline dehydrogenase-like flavoprotein